MDRFLHSWWEQINHRTIEHYSRIFTVTLFTADFYCDIVYSRLYYGIVYRKKKKSYLETI